MTLLDVDESVVHAGWLPLVLTLLVLGVVFLLGWSMRRHLRIAETFPSVNDLAAERRAEATVTTPAESQSPDDAPKD